MRRVVIPGCLVCLLPQLLAQESESVARARALRVEAESRLGDRRLQVARKKLRAALESLRDVPRSDAYAVVEHWQIGSTARRAKAWAVAEEAWAAVCEHYEKVTEQAPKYLPLARVHLGTARAHRLGNAGRIEPARREARATMKALREIQMSDGLDPCWAIATLALDRLQDYGVAEEGYRRVVEYYATLKLTTKAEKDFYKSARSSLAAALCYLRREHEALPLQEQIVKECEALPAAHPERVRARFNLGMTLHTTHDFERAHKLFKANVDALRASGVPEYHEFLLENRRLESNELACIGRYRQALAILQEILSICEKHFDARNPRIPEIRLQVGGYHRQLGGPKRARPIVERAIEEFQQILAPTDPKLLNAREVLADTLGALGDRDQAEETWAELARIGSASLDDSNMNLMRWRLRQAHLMHLRGESEEAAVRMRNAIEKYTSRYTAEQLSMQAQFYWECSLLANVLRSLGDFPAALAWYEWILRNRESLLPDEANSLNQARSWLAATKARCGDFQGALPLYRSVLEARLKTDTETRPFAVHRARANLAYCLGGLGQREAAFTLNRRILSDLKEARLTGKRLYAVTCNNLAGRLRARGEHDDARTLFERAIRWCETRAPRDRLRHVAKGGLALTHWRTGDPRKARIILEQTIKALQGDTKYAQQVSSQRRQLLLILAEIGDAAAIRHELNALLREARQRLFDAFTLSVREVGQVAKLIRRDIAVALSVADHAKGEPPIRGIFELIETLRVASGPIQAEHLYQEDGEIASLRDQALRARRRLNDLVGAIGPPVREPGGERALPIEKELERAIRERDRIGAALRAKLRGLTPTITVESVSQNLRRGSAAVGYHRFSRKTTNPKTHKPVSEDVLIAHVVTSFGFKQVLLGPVSKIEALVERWRAGIGQPVRGRAPKRRRDRVRELGQSLRRAVLDPVLAACGDAKKVFLCLDDALRLVPFDALPASEGTGRAVGDGGVSLVILPSFASLARREKPPSTRPKLVAFGGIDFDKANTSGSEKGKQKFATPPLAANGTGPSGLFFDKLPASKSEVLAIGQRFSECHERGQSDLRTGMDATKTELHRLAPGATHIHLATHGYFVPETVLSDEESQESIAMSTEARVAELVHGLAPMTLCGLALSGANRGRDAVGRVPGIITAEELAGVDLRRCELAVLSACETNVGIRRAGQGIRSLQAALHAAGVRTAITTLWRVDDDAAKKLMGAFYKFLWVDRDPPDKALWKAKTTLRNGGAELRDWAGWVLTGYVDRQK